LGINLYTPTPCAVAFLFSRLCQPAEQDRHLVIIDLM
jgi:hypothetical protein